MGNKSKKKNKKKKNYDSVSTKLIYSEEGQYYAVITKMLGDGRVMLKYVNGKNPDDYKIEHIFKGDRGDGIPNILSPDNTFTDGLRQRPLGKKKIDDWKQVGTWPIDSWNDELKRNFQRNSKLIDLSLIPDEIKNNIYKCWNEKYDNTRSKILPYFMKHRLRELTERLGDF